MTAEDDAAERLDQRLTWLAAEQGSPCGRFAALLDPDTQTLTVASTTTGEGFAVALRELPALLRLLSSYDNLGMLVGLS